MCRHWPSVLRKFFAYEASMTAPSERAKPVAEAKRGVQLWRDAEHFAERGDRQRPFEAWLALDGFHNAPSTSYQPVELATAWLQVGALQQGARAGSGQIQR